MKKSNIYLTAGIVILVVIFVNVINKNHHEQSVEKSVETQALVANIIDDQSATNAKKPEEQIKTPSVAVGQPVEAFNETMPPSFDPLADDAHAVSYSTAEQNIIDIFFLMDDQQSSRQMTPTSEEYITHGKSIDLRVDFLKTLTVGQIVNFPMNSGHPMAVKTVNHRKNGTTKIVFTFPEKQPIYRGFFTIGQKATFGRIVAPGATYQVEAANGEGWIVDTRHIDDKMPKFGVDYVVPSS